MVSSNNTHNTDNTGNLANGHQDYGSSCMYATNGTRTYNNNPSSCNPQTAAVYPTSYPTGNDDLNVQDMSNNAYYTNLHNNTITQNVNVATVGKSPSGRSNHHGKSPKSKSRSSYKHIPHSEKPPHLVQRRNARERRRVQSVNSAFLRLRKHIPYENRNKRLSKVKTLKIAINYIEHMQQLINAYDTKVLGTQTSCPHQQSGCIPNGGVNSGGSDRSQRVEEREMESQMMHRQVQLQSRDGDMDAKWQQHYDEMNHHGHGQDNFYTMFGQV